MSTPATKETVLAMLSDFFRPVIHTRAGTSRMLCRVWPNWIAETSTLLYRESQREKFISGMRDYYHVKSMTFIVASLDWSDLHLTVLSTHPTHAAALRDAKHAVRGDRVRQTEQARRDDAVAAARHAAARHAALVTANAARRAAAAARRDDVVAAAYREAAAAAASLSPEQRAALLAALSQDDTPAIPD